MKELVKENLGYEELLQGVRSAPLYYRSEDVDGYIQLMVDTICTTLPTVRIGRQELPAQDVREVMLLLRQEHVLYVMERIASAQIEYNPLGYKLTALYNAACTYGDYALRITA